MSNYPIMLPGSIDTGKPAQKKIKPTPPTKKTHLPKGLYTPPAAKKKPVPAEIRVLKPSADDLAYLSKKQLKSQPVAKERLNNIVGQSILSGFKNGAGMQVNRVNSAATSFRHGLVFLTTTQKGVLLSFKWLCLSLLVILCSLIVFLSYFDSYHLVKEWDIEFAEDSYLDRQSLERVLEHLKRNRVNYILPANNYWLLNDQLLTESARSSFPQIQNISVKELKYPNRAKIQIATTPLLLSLSVNTPRGIQIWRVDTSGRLFSQDTANRMEKVVYVDRSVTFDRPDTSLGDIRFFEDNPEQLDRLYFISYTWEILQSYGVLISYTSIPSLNSADKDVTLHFPNGSKLLLNSSILDRNSYENRLKTILKSNLIQSLEQGRIKYLDLRQSGRVFSCC